MRILDFLRRLFGKNPVREISTDPVLADDECVHFKPEPALDPEVVRYMFIEGILNRMDNARPTREWYREWHRPPNVIYFDPRNPFDHK